ncbi:MAG: hypothetical protein RPR40_07420, partial [Bermanella sp.]
ATKDYYAGTNKLYIVIGHYTGTGAGNDASTGVWDLDAKFVEEGRVIATELSAELASSLAAVEIVKSSVHAGVRFQPLANISVQSTRAMTFSGEDRK